LLNKFAQRKTTFAKPGQRFDSSTTTVSGRRTTVLVVCFRGGGLWFLFSFGPHRWERPIEKLDDAGIRYLTEEHEEDGTFGIDWPREEDSR
jgi:hypothetical protein